MLRGTLIVISIYGCCRRCSFFIVSLPLFFLLAGLFCASVYADGGAPQLAYIAGAARGIGVIDIAQRRVTNTIALMGEPRTVLLSPDGHALYVTQPALGAVTILAAKTGKPLCTAHLAGQPALLALSLDASVLYAAGQGDTRVWALDPQTCAVQRTFETHSPVYGLAVAASTAADATPATPNQLWITGATALTVFEVDGHLLGSIPVAAGPQYITIPGGFTAYVTTRQGTVLAVDLNTRHIERTLLRQGQFGPMDYDANTGEVYVPDKQHDQLDVLAPVTLSTPSTLQEPARVLHLSSSPQSVAITSDGQLAFVALSNGQVLMFDVPGRSVVTSIEVGGSPHFIITGLYPPANGSLPTSQQTTPFRSSGAVNVPLLVVMGALVGVVLLCMLWFVWARLRRRRML